MQLFSLFSRRRPQRVEHKRPALAVESLEDRIILGLASSPLGVAAPTSAPALVAKMPPAAWGEGTVT
jgi:hypothetical protein